MYMGEGWFHGKAWVSLWGLKTISHGRKAGKHSVGRRSFYALGIQRGSWREFKEVLHQCGSEMGRGLTFGPGTPGKQGLCL